MSERKPNEFEKAAAESSRGGFFRDLWGFLCESKKWWLLPILIVLLLFGFLLLLAGTGLGPFIYTLW